MPAGSRGAGGRREQQGAVTKQPGPCLQGLHRTWYLAMHGDVEADAVELQQVPVELPLGVPVVGGSSAGDTGCGSESHSSSAQRGGQPVPHDGGGCHVPVHTSCPLAGWDTGDVSAAVTRLASAAAHQHPPSTQPGATGGTQFRVSTGVDSHTSLPPGRCCPPQLQRAGTTTAPWH